MTVCEYMCPLQASTLFGFVLESIGTWYILFLFIYLDPRLGADGCLQRWSHHPSVRLVACEPSDLSHLRFNALIVRPHSALERLDS